MYNPAHPGFVLREYLGDIAVTDAAKSLGITRAALSRILNSNAGISADMALRLEAALGTRAEMWTEMQSQYELWIASQHKRPEIKPMEYPVCSAAEIIHDTRDLSY
ncbi:similar to virulence-associated protein and proteic killer activ protein [Photorhabdus asymbiotica]|uniref:Addiction module HigA family antidote n=3 Tax=Morganellaceae TaxID=1903414 RepID=A0ABX9SLI6_9GAMM|nr:addiction module HigA family antidote [Photorhabdus asymbiotica]CAQ84705.1 similar to virulence-associated protein and proteic killer activ protein [Photorhabdus asymbiotica]